MVGKIKNLTKEEFESLNDGIYFLENGFHVIISCQYIQSWKQLAEALGNAFQFPMRNEGLDGTWDWLTDLSWLGDQTKINIYFYNEKELFRNNYSLKKQVFEWFESLIHFWEIDVKEAFIAGKPGKSKTFEIYLIN